MKLAGPLCLIVFAAVLTVPLPAQQPPPAAAPPAGAGFTLTVGAWPDGDDIPLKYTQAVPSPESRWKMTPAPPKMPAPSFFCSPTEISTSGVLQM